MKKKILVLLVIIAILVGGFFAAKKFVPKMTGVIDECQNLTAEQCELNNNCFGVYGPSYCNGNTCTADMTFKECQKASKEIQKLRTEMTEKKSACEKFGAKYNEGYERCDCKSPFEKWVFDEKTYFEFLKNGGPQTFVEKKGCETAKEFCETKSGEWVDNFKPFLVVEAKNAFDKGRFTMTKDQCKNEDQGCYSYSDRGKEETRCFYRWNEVANRCDLAVYRKNEINRPCKIGDAYFDSESLLKSLTPTTPRLPGSTQPSN